MSKIVLLKKHRDALKIAADQAVDYVTGMLAKGDAGKGGLFRTFILHNPKAGFRGLAQLHKVWVGGDSNINEFQKYEAVSWLKPLWIASHAIEIINHRDKREFMASSEDRGQKRTPAGAIMFKCVIPGFMRDEPVYIIFVLSGLDQWSDEAVMFLTANIMRLRHEWKVQVVHLHGIMNKSRNPHHAALELLLEAE